MPRGPVFSPTPRLAARKKPKPAGKAFSGARGECEACQRGDGRLPCTCVVQDRCSSIDDGGGGQCIRGVSHPGMRHCNAAGKHWT